jgi:hypothetical protein
MLVTALTLAGGCAGGTVDRDATESGRTYTEWFYGQDFDRLWERFSPEMKRTFPTAAELARFASETVNELGAEQGRIEEAVSRQDTVTVYSRTASFAKARERMLVEWTLGRDGAVTGFVIRPARDTAGAS